MNNRKNIYSALLNQIILIAYGLIVPRLIICTFGSEINGLVSSITQFLSFIILLEGGLGAVVLAELYKPIEDHNVNRIKGILAACQRFFNRLSIWFIVYTIIIAIVFSVKMQGQHTWVYTSVLVFIISIITLAQYLFSITNRLFLQAEQKIYIVNNVISVSLVVNIILAIISIRVYPNIHLLKVASSISFFIQPIVFQHFIKPEYKEYRRNMTDTIELKNRWSGFGQNLAHFVNMNTDVVLITVFSTLANVSVYTVYCLAINALRMIVASIGNSYQSSLGKYIVQGNDAATKDNFLTFCNGIWALSTILYCTCLIMINPFVQLYVGKVGDADYFQPIFAAIIILANYVYCIREPYRLLILSAGKFKETNNGAVIEAILNIGISVVLIFRFGLIGVAIGTLVAMLYRMIYFIMFLRNNIIRLEIKEIIKPYLKLAAILAINYIVYFKFKIDIQSIGFFIIYGVLTLMFESAFTALFYLGPGYSIKLIKSACKKIMKK